MLRQIEIITLFPELFSSLLETRIFKKGMEKVSIRVTDLRGFAKDKRRSVDDTPYGGGCGMILKPEPLSLALDDFGSRAKGNKRIIYLSPQGTRFTQAYAKGLMQAENLCFISGRYEGIDQRIIDLYVDEELSIGDFVLAGGELPAMVVTETVLRLIPGVLGNEESMETDSFSNGLLKYPQYTRPERFKGISVPRVLLSGDHKKITRWRRTKSLIKTKETRPDIFSKVKLGDEDAKLFR